MLRDLSVNQLIMETAGNDVFDLASLTANEFDVPATLVPERETELHGLLQFLREKLQLEKLPDVSGKIHRVEEKFNDVFQLVRPHLHQELRRYIVLRMLKKDLKDIVFGFGPLQDLLRTHHQRNYGGQERPDICRAERRDRKIGPSVHFRQSD